MKNINLYNVYSADGKKIIENATANSIATLLKVTPSTVRGGAITGSTVKGNRVEGAKIRERNTYADKFKKEWEETRGLFRKKIRQEINKKPCYELVKDFENKNTRFVIKNGQIEDVERETT